MLTTIGLGNQLDSELLLQMSNMFLHMPDPGSVGPFMVNLLASLRSTARLPDPAGGSAANHINLVVSPASAVDPASLVGYGKRAEVTTLPGIEGQVLAVELGSAHRSSTSRVTSSSRCPERPSSRSRSTRNRDQRSSAPTPTPSGASADAHASADHRRLAHHPCAPLTLPSPLPPQASDAQKRRLQRPSRRSTAHRGGGGRRGGGDRAASVAAVVEQIKASSATDVAAATALLQTLESEVLLGCNDANWRKWGSHYCRTSR